jgi:hypothetical protein
VPTKRAADWWDSAAFSSIFLASGFSCSWSFISSRPPAANANRWAVALQNNKGFQGDNIKVKSAKLSTKILVQIILLAFGTLTGCSSVKTQDSSSINSQVIESYTSIALTPSRIPTLKPYSIQKQLDNGVEFVVSNIYSDENGNVLADVCYTLPGVGVWDINQAMIKYVNGESPNFETQETSIKIANSPTETGERCTTLKFSWLPDNADLSSLTLEINAIGLANPQEGHECEELNLRKQVHEKELSELGLILSCDSSNGQTQMNVISKPSQMSSEEAQRYVDKYIYGWINGNWIFTGSIKK